MEAQTAQPSTSAGPSYPRWVMLEQYYHYILDDDSAADDDKTTAVACTSASHLIQFSLYIEAPLATATVRIHVPDDGKVEVVECDCFVVAAHGDSLLIRVGFDEKQYQQGYTTDHFVYNASDAATATGPPQPPTLSLLPPCYDDEDKSVRRWLGHYALGLLRRGEDELVVAMLRKDRPVPELCLFHSGSGEWTVKRVPISYSDVLRERLPSVWVTVVPVGDRLLCWVNLPSEVVVICDGVFEESPRLLYLRLPMDPCHMCSDMPSNENRNVCATTDSDTLKFVNILPRCGCGSASTSAGSASGCEPSHHAYSVHTWTLRMDGDGDMVEWVKDGMIDCTELWALDAYKGLPCVPLDHPVVSLDEPHVIYFQLCESHHVKVKDGGDHTLWQLKVDMRSKTIQSVSPYEDWFSYTDDILIPSNVSHFLNSYPSDGTGSLAH